MREGFIAVSAIKGRGSASHMAHRFSTDQRDPFDDGWSSLDDALQAPVVPPATVVTSEVARSAITRNNSPDIHFDYGLNP